MARLVPSCTCPLWSSPQSHLCVGLFQLGVPAARSEGLDRPTPLSSDWEAVGEGQRVGGEPCQDVYSCPVTIVYEGHTSSGGSVWTPLLLQVPVTAPPFTLRAKLPNPPSQVSPNSAHTFVNSPFSTLPPNYPVQVFRLFPEAICKALGACSR